MKKNVDCIFVCLIFKFPLVTKNAKKCVSSVCWLLSKYHFPSWLFFFISYHRQRQIELVVLVLISLKKSLNCYSAPVPKIFIELLECYFEQIFYVHNKLYKLMSDSNIKDSNLRIHTNHIKNVHFHENHAKSRSFF